MPSFDPLFATVLGAGSIEYKGKKLIRLDHILFEDGDRFKITFEKKTSSWRQGILLSLFGYFEVDGKMCQDRIILWEDTAPKEVLIAAFQDKSKRKQPNRLPNKGVLGVKNIWDTGNGTIESWYNGAAMQTEEIENGKRYCCNDGHPDENFDDIIFTIQKVK